MLAAEIRNAYPPAVKFRAGLLESEKAMHSVRPCLFVLDEWDSWADFCSSQQVLIKKVLIESGVGERLREEREKLGMNQTDFGLAAGVSRGTQKAYELESSSPDVRYLCTLQGIGVDVIYILTGNRAGVPLGDLSMEEHQVLDMYRSLPESDKHHIHHSLSAFAELASRHNR